MGLNGGSSLEKSHSYSLLIANRNIYLWARNSIVDTYFRPNLSGLYKFCSFYVGSLKSKKKGQVLEFQNVPGCGLRALVGHLQDLTEAGKQSEDILNYVNLRQKVRLENIALYAF